MAKVLIVGGGLAGLACAAALGGDGFDVDVLESRPFFGGRATSWPVAGDDSGELIDNCQHVLLRCCHNLLDFYERLGVAGDVRFYRQFYFIEPGGRVSTMQAAPLPAPFHFSLSFPWMRCFSLADKAAIARAMLAIRHERQRPDLDSITMLAWLQQHRQTPNAIERFWRQILVSAVNEELDRMAASHGLQVFWLGMLADRRAYEMGVPNVPLRDLYRAAAWTKIGRVHLHPRSAVSHIAIDAGRVLAVETADGPRLADAYVSALPFERMPAVVPGLALDVSPFEHSPITGIHLWFDRPVTDLPHATLLDRTIQWMFNKSEGRYVQLVVSASRSLTAMPRAELIDLALREMQEFFPKVQAAQLERAHVVKEVRATFSARPGLETLRPTAATDVENLFLAGDWTRSGWPATMEGAVRSGYLAAEAVAAKLGRPARYLIAD